MRRLSAEGNPERTEADRQAGAGLARQRHSGDLSIAHWVDPVDLPFADIGDFATALGDIAASMKLIEEQARSRPHWIVPGLGVRQNVAVLRAMRQRDIKGQQASYS